MNDPGTNRRSFGDPVPRIVEASGDGSRCRCGTRLLVGSTRLELVGAPPNIRAIFESQSFCSHRCIRAFFLETIETLDGMSMTSSAAMVSDLHLIYQTTVETFAQLLASSRAPK